MTGKRTTSRPHLRQDQKDAYLKDIDHAIALFDGGDVRGARDKAQFMAEAHGDSIGSGATRSLIEASDAPQEHMVRFHLNEARGDVSIALTD